MKLIIKLITLSLLISISNNGFSQVENVLRKMQDSDYELTVKAPNGVSIYISKKGEYASLTYENNSDRYSFSDGKKLYTVQGEMAGVTCISDRTGIMMFPYLLLENQFQAVAKSDSRILYVETAIKDKYDNEKFLEVEVAGNANEITSFYGMEIVSTNIGEAPHLKKTTGNAEVMDISDDCGDFIYNRNKEAYDRDQSRRKQAIRDAEPPKPEKISGMKWRELVYDSYKDEDFGNIGSFLKSNTSFYEDKISDFMFLKLNSVSHDTKKVTSVRTGRNAAKFIWGNTNVSTSNNFDIDFDLSLWGEVLSKGFTGTVFRGNGRLFWGASGYSGGYEIRIDDENSKLSVYEPGGNRIAYKDITIKDPNDFDNPLGTGIEKAAQFFYQPRHSIKVRHYSGYYYLWFQDQYLGKYKAKSTPGTNIGFGLSPNCRFSEIQMRLYEIR